MIATLLRYLIIIAVVHCLDVAPVYAQGPALFDSIIPASYKPEFNRLRNHELIDAEQKAIMNTDGKADQFFTPSANDDINLLLTQVLTKQVDILQYNIETDSFFDHRLKVNYLKGLENILHYYRQNWKLKTEKKVNPVHFFNAAEPPGN